MEYAVKQREAVMARRDAAKAAKLAAGETEQLARTEKGGITVNATGFRPP